MQQESHMTTTTRPRHLTQRPAPAARIILALHSRASVTLAGVALGSAVLIGGVAVSAPAMAAPASAQVVVLQLGSHGSLVTIAQQRLGISADGNFGPGTKSAVMAFQGRQGLTRDGVIGPMTWAKLGGFPGSSAPVAAPTCSVNVVRYGMSGSLVTALQKQLGTTADGQFGPLTLSVVKSFQTTHKISADGYGVVGSATWSALGGMPCGLSLNPPPTSTPAPGGGGATTATAAQVAQVVAIATKYLGVPYVYGGSTPKGFDCSGLTSYSYAQVGLSLPRVAAAQQSYLKSTTTPLPGDLVFFGRPAHHVGIYIGNGQMIAAPYPGQVVRIQAIYQPTNYGTLR